MIFLDTHAVAWLYQGELNRFTEPGRDMLEREDLRISPLVLLELTYLHEIGRLRVTANDIFAYLYATVGLAEDQSPYSSIVGRAQELTWTRDPFDRMIVAHAEVAGSPLLTKDFAIHRNCKRAVW